MNKQVYSPPPDGSTGGLFPIVETMYHNKDVPNGLKPRQQVFLLLSIMFNNASYLAYTGKQIPLGILENLNNGIAYLISLQKNPFENFGL